MSGAESLSFPTYTAARNSLGEVAAARRTAARDARRQYPHGDPRAGWLLGLYLDVLGLRDEEDDRG